MSLQNINIGQQANDGTGDSIRTAFEKANAMFTELYIIATGGTGLKLTNLIDTPQRYIPSTTSTATLLAIDLYGNTVTQKTLVAGKGIVITNTSSNLVISAPITGLASDTSPYLTANISGTAPPGSGFPEIAYNAINFADPINPQDLSTKNYVDNNSPYSTVNIYVKTDGRTTAQMTSAGVPAAKQGRSLAYAYSSINEAAQLAEKIINTATYTLSSYQQYVTYGNGQNTATIYSIEPSPTIPGATRILIDYYTFNGTDQYNQKDQNGNRSPNIRPGQYFLGAESGTVGFIETFGHVSELGITNFNSATCYRDTGLIIDALALDIAFPTAGVSQTTFAGLQYYYQNTSTSVVTGGLTTTTDAVSHLRSVARQVAQGQLVTVSTGNTYVQTTSGAIGASNTTGSNIINNDFTTIINILNSGTSSITDAIIPNGLTSSTNAYVWNAYNQLQNNRSFLIAEVNAYVTATHAGFVYNSINLARDIGNMIDSVCFDLLYPNPTLGPANRQAIQTGVYYYPYTTSTNLLYETSATILAYNHLASVAQQLIVSPGSVTPSPGNAITPVTNLPFATSAQQISITNIINTLTNIIQNGPLSAQAAPTPISLSPSYSSYDANAAAILEANRTFLQSEIIAYLYNSSFYSNYEYYDVVIGGENNFIPQSQQGQQTILGEPLLFAYEIPKSQISILIESGVYEEQYPIRVPANVSVKGDEVRRVLVRPAAGQSTSKWTNLYFRRDSSFDNLTVLSPDNSGQGLAYKGYEYGYHYLTDPTDPTSPPKLNSELDVFLLNDTTIITGMTIQGHGGFACVFDPEGQILTKSPYIYKATSFSFSINAPNFAGGMYVDGFSGNLLVTATNTTTYFLGTSTITVGSPSTNTGLFVRNPSKQVPVSFFNLGNRYQVVYFTNYDKAHGTATLNLNPYNAGGVAYPNGVIPIPVGQGGSGYSPFNPPQVIFSPPDLAGGYTAQGTATIATVGIYNEAVAHINITNPGTGYINSITVTIIGGNPVTPAASFTISTSSIAGGFIGKLPQYIELNTPGNKSMLTSDFTQMNDLGYGIVTNNNGIVEAVSVFCYYNHTAYFANNGGSIRSLNGSCAFGDISLKAVNGDPNEVPIPVQLKTDMIQTATIVSSDWSAVNGGINTANTSGSSVLYIRNPQTLTSQQQQTNSTYPDISVYSNAQIEINYGKTTNNNGNYLGLQTYNITSANTVSNSVTDAGGWLIKLQLATSLIGGATGLPAPISSGTIVTINGYKQLYVQGINRKNLLDPNLAAVVFTDNTATSYGIASITDVTTGTSDLLLSTPYNYVNLVTFNTSTNSNSVASSGTSTITILPLNTSTGDGARLLANASTSTTATNYTFSWNGTIHQVTGYTYATGGLPYDTVTIYPALTSTVTNYSLSNPYGNVSLPAGIRAGTIGNIYTRISTMRATGHDLFNIGSGGYDESRYPNDIYGPSINTPNPSNERVSVGTGRVFAITTDQDGNFRIGDFFAVNQASGSVNINANINLTQVSGLQFIKGVLVNEFSTDVAMAEASSAVVPTQPAVIGYVNSRLGLDQLGRLISNDSLPLIGPGYLDLTGVQTMKGNITMAGNNISMSPDLTRYTTYSVGGGIAPSGMIVNLTTTTYFNGSTNHDAVNKGYADGKLSLAGISAVDSLTNTVNPAFGQMYGALQLFRDPINTDPSNTAATKRYVDQRAEFASLPDVSLTNPTNQDILMFSSTAIPYNTGSNYAVWAATQQVVNVSLYTPSPTNTPSGSAGGSDVTFTRIANTVTIKLVGGGGATAPITNYHINSGAAISQSKLNLQAATTTGPGNPSSFVQSNLGLSQYDNTYFTACYGYVSLKTPSSLLTNMSCCVCYSLTAGAGLVTNPASTTYNGSSAVTFCVNNTSAATPNTVVCRDSTAGGGNFSAGVITASLSGNATSATCLQTARCIGGTSFNGTDNITPALSTCANNLYGQDGNYRSAIYNAATAYSITQRDDSGNITANTFNGNLSGNATSANYADLAENYQADRSYAPCTVLEFGGSCEVTIAGVKTRALAGVVSTNPAHLMNGGLTGDGVIALALTGRVPCLVRGPVRKGDMMVSAGGGYAMSDPDPKLGTVIGKALEDFDGEEGVIEVVVGRL